MILNICSEELVWSWNVSLVSHLCLDTGLGSGSGLGLDFGGGLGLGIFFARLVLCDGSI